MLWPHTLVACSAMASYTSSMLLVFLLCWETEEHFYGNNEMKRASMDQIRIKLRYGLHLGEKSFSRTEAMMQNKLGMLKLIEDISQNIEDHKPGGKVRLL